MIVKLLCSILLTVVCSTDHGTSVHSLKESLAQVGWHNTVSTTRVLANRLSFLFLGKKINCVLCGVTEFFCSIFLCVGIWNHRMSSWPRKELWSWVRFLNFLKYISWHIYYMYIYWICSAFLKSIEGNYVFFTATQSHTHDINTPPCQKFTLELPTMSPPPGDYLLTFGALQLCLTVVLTCNFPPPPPPPPPPPTPHLDCKQFPLLPLWFITTNPTHKTVIIYWHLGHYNFVLL